MTIKNKGGRPPKITESWCKRTAKTLPEMFKQGQSITEVVYDLGICWTSWSKAIAMSKELMEAKKEGLKVADRWWSAIARKAVIGQIPGFNSTVWIFTMKNRFGWRDKQDIKMDGEIKIVIDKDDEEL